MSRVILLLLSMLFVSCGENVASKKATGPLSTAVISTIASLNDSCAIALTPHDLATAKSATNVDSADTQIVRYQTEARKAQHAAPYLEKLGWAFVAKARTSFDPGFYTLADQTALCLEAIQPQSAEAILLRVSALHNRHGFKAAESLARQLVSTRGNWFEYGLLGDAQMEQGRLDDAADSYQEMMDQRPGPHAYSRAAHLRFLKGDLAGAIELMEMTVRATSVQTTEPAAWARSQAALYHFYGGRMTQAASWIDDALHLDEDYAPALLLQGQLLLADGQIDQAIISLNRAARQNPLPHFLWPLIEALHLANRFDEAEAVEFELVNDGARNDPRTYALYLATSRRDLDTALQLTEQELALREDVYTLDARAWALHAAGDNAAALEFSQRALAEGTQDAMLFYHAGVITAAAGQLEHAERLLSKAVANSHVLLPSERERLHLEFAALQAHLLGPTATGASHDGQPGL